MAATPEAKVKRAVAARLRAAGAYYFFPVTGGFGSSGVPDIVGCLAGVFFGIECKAGRNRPTALQLHNLGRIREAGGVALLVSETNASEVVRLIAGRISNLEIDHEECDAHRGDERPDDRDGVRGDTG